MPLTRIAMFDAIVAQERVRALLALFVENCEEDPAICWTWLTSISLRIDALASDPAQRFASAHGYTSSNMQLATQQDLSLIAQILGVLLVPASLVFVGMQMRQTDAIDATFFPTDRARSCIASIGVRRMTLPDLPPDDLWPLVPSTEVVRLTQFGLR